MLLHRSYALDPRALVPAAAAVRGECKEAEAALKELWAWGMLDPHPIMEIPSTLKPKRSSFLCCRHGHNELDEPSATLPLTYRSIAEHPRVLQLYSERLQSSGLVTAAEVEGWQRDAQER